MMRDKLQILKVFLLECFIWVGFFLTLLGVALGTVALRHALLFDGCVPFEVFYFALASIGGVIIASPMSLRVDWHISIKGCARGLFWIIAPLACALGICALTYWIIKSLGVVAI